MLGPKAALAKLDRMMPILETNIIGALSVEATLEAGNDIVLKLPKKAILGAGAYNTIRESLSFDLSMHLARLFDRGSRHRPANTKDAASIPLMIRLLRQTRCRRLLAKRARNDGNFHKELADLFERGCHKAIEDASKAYTVIFRGKLGQAGLKRLKIARDNQFAHSLMLSKRSKLTYRQLSYLTDSARDLLEHASVAVVGRSLALGDLEVHFRREAEIFWNRALLGKADDPADLSK